MKKWNFGIIGAGVIANFHAKAILDIENAELVAVCDKNNEKADKFASEYSCNSYYDYLELLNNNDIDVVTIATPSGSHMEVAVDAAKNGKHVLCEKPLDIDLARIDTMIKTHEEHGTQLGCIFQNRYTEASQLLKKAVLDERFGKITYCGVYVPWWREETYYKDSWHGTWRLDGGGALMNQSIHMIDMLCYLMPDVIDLSAFAEHKAHNIEAEDTAVAILKFSNKSLGVIYGTTASFPGQFKRLEITGTDGTAIYEEDIFKIWKFRNELPEDIEIRQKYAKVKGMGGVADPASISCEYHKKNFKAFLDALDSGKKFELDGYEGRKAIDLILRIYRSAGIIS
jgi:UDP-N-acetyl-2-amino-2-deoxyglucuronate dehydrogenase